jgi:hypothetical protein
MPPKESTRPAQQDRTKTITAIPERERLIALIFLILEAAFGATIFAIPQNQRFWAFIIFAVILSAAAFIAFGLLRSASQPAVPAMDYKALTRELTDNDVRVLAELGRMNNTMPMMLFACSPDKPAGTDKFARRLVLLTEHQLVSTVGGSEVAITDDGRKFLRRAQADERYKQVFQQPTVA